MATELSSASAASNARLLLAFAMRSSNPAQEFGSLVSTLLNPGAPSEDVQASAGGHAGSVESAAAQEAGPAAPSNGLQASQLLLADALVRSCRHLLPAFPMVQPSVVTSKSLCKSMPMIWRTS